MRALALIFVVGTIILSLVMLIDITIAS